MIVLGIETTCDETSVSIVEKKKTHKFCDFLKMRQILKFQKPQNLRTK